MNKLISIFLVIVYPLFYGLEQCHFFSTSRKMSKGKAALED